MTPGSLVVIEGLLATILDELGSDITKVLGVLNAWIIHSGGSRHGRANASMSTSLLADHMQVPFEGVLVASGHRVALESAVLGIGNSRVVLSQYNATHAVTLHQKIPLAISRNLEGEPIEKVLSCQAFGTNKVIIDQVQDLPAGTSIILQSLEPHFERWPEPLLKGGK